MSIKQLASAAVACACAMSLAGPAAGARLATTAVAPDSAAQATAHDGVVEAARQTAVSAQVAGVIVAVPVAAGDRVQAGQVLVRIDARAAIQQSDAAAAQLQAAQAADAAATQELERQRQLFRQRYISQAALDRAEAQFKSALAQTAAQRSAAAAARTESGYFTIKAPYGGVVSEVSVVQGDMALPGRPLLTLYDPATLRVSAAVAQSALPAAGSAPLVDLAGPDARRITPTRWQALPAADAATHTVVLRLDLPPGTPALPGMFARVWLPGRVDGTARLWVPGAAVVRRAELTGVYVVSDDGHASLHLVRLGATAGDRVELLSGVAPGEHVALDPQAAARVR